MGKPAVRRAREKRNALSPDDGRRKRATGRTAQFNVKMKPELKRQIVQAEPRPQHGDLDPRRTSLCRYPGQTRTEANDEGPRADRMVIAYGLALVSAATASLYGFMSAAGPYGYVKGAGLFGVAFIGCHGPAWIVKAKQRLGWPGAVFGCVVTAVCMGATLWGGLGTNASGGGDVTSGALRAIKKQADDERNSSASCVSAQTCQPSRRNRCDGGRGPRGSGSRRGIRQRECGNGDPKQRGPTVASARQRNRPSTTHSAAILAAKDATDKAARLDAEAAAIRTRRGASSQLTEIDPQASASHSSRVFGSNVGRTQCVLAVAGLRARSHVRDDARIHEQHSAFARDGHR